MMRIERIFQIITVTFLLFNFTSCMATGMHHSLNGDNLSILSKNIKILNNTRTMDDMIEEMVKDLASAKLKTRSIAVWRLNTKTAGINVEVIRQKLINRLLKVQNLKVISRERLNELLKEQSLSLSGSIEENSAVPIGKLMGVDGFIDGHVLIDNNVTTFSLKLIDSGSGQILWGKVLEQNITR